MKLLFRHERRYIKGRSENRPSWPRRQDPEVGAAVVEDAISIRYGVNRRDDVSVLARPHDIYEPEKPIHRQQVGANYVKRWLL